MKRLVGCGLATLALGWSTAAFALPPAAPPQRGGTGHASQGYLGIDVRDVNDDELSSLRLRDVHGAEIIRVDHDGPAGKMGLREHDVVMQLNGAPIEGEAQMRQLLREIAPGGAISMMISRDGQQMAKTGQMADHSQIERQAWELHLSAPPPQGPQAPATGLPSEDPAVSGGQAASAAPVPASKYSKGFLGTILLTPAYTGVMLERLGPQLAQFFGVPKGTGLLVKAVEANSPAAVAGVRAGDVVVRADARTVVSMTDWTKAIRDAKGRPVTVLLLRDRQEKTLLLIPDARKHT